MNLRYYLRNEHKEKWNTLWRFAVLIIAEVFVLLISGAMTVAYNPLVAIMGSIVLFGSMFFVLALELMIIYNQIVSKYFEGQKTELKPVLKKTLAAAVYIVVVIIVYEIIFWISVIMGLIAFNGFVSFLLFVVNVLLLVLIAVIAFVLYYAIFDTLGNQQPGFGVTFKRFGQIFKVDFKRTLLGGLKCLLLGIIAIIVYLIIYLIVILIMAIINVSVITFILGIGLFVLAIAMYFIIGMGSLQYIVALHYTDQKMTTGEETETTEIA